MNVTIKHASSLQGTLSVPPDKSIAHRAILAAALCHGATTITRLPAGDDCQRTLRFVEQLGVRVRRRPEAIEIEGRGIAQPFRQPGQDLFCGESGTTLRLTAGLLAGQPWEARLTAAPSLAKRPMRRVIEPLAAMGAQVTGSRAGQDIYPPLTVQGKRPLTAIRYTLPVASAQVKSAILLAGLFAEGRTTVIEPVPTRDHTERLLSACGAWVKRDGSAISIEPGELTSPARLVIPGDSSSAAFFVVAASCVPGSRIALEAVGLNPSRTAFLDVLKRMGAGITITLAENAWEPRGRIVVEARALQPVRIPASEAAGLIDELPILMVAAACAAGRSRFEGVAELRVKETDRIASMVGGLRRLGVRIDCPAADVVDIDGGPLAGGEVDSVGDHRTAMSLAVAGLAASGITTIVGAECAAKSFPEFFEYLQQIAPPTTVKAQS